MSAGGTLFIVAAPSGAGKTVVIKRLLAEVPDLQFSVSWTTRAPRAGEVDGAAYHFVDETTFRAKVARGEFLEWASVHGRLYGTERAETFRALEAGRDLLLDIDVQGAAQVRAAGLACASVFLLPPDRETLLARLSGRRTDSAAAIEERMRDAADEVRRFKEFDYLVINEDLGQAVTEVVAIVRAERARRARREARAQRIAASFPAGEGR
ncbi:MAG: guanylate kinase [Acidobacteria bacterium]|nr:guanylate kinase [Acidobacteriota bacterium]